MFSSYLSYGESPLFFVFVFCFVYRPFSSGPSDKNVKVIAAALEALAQASLLREGAEAAVDAKAFNYVTELLESSSLKVKEQTCRLLENSAGHHHIGLTSAILSAKVFELLVSLST